MIYLDNAATTFPKPDSVIAAVNDFLTNCGANPGRGGHYNSIRAAEMVGNCQIALSKLFSIPSPERIVFTKNATEALNAAIFGTISPGDEIIISSMEHNSVMRAAHRCTALGAKLKIARATEKGRVLPETIKQLITNKTKLICTIHSSNVTGTVNDIYKIQEIAKKHNVLALFDCAQSAGIIPIDASKLDMIAFSGHKGLFGPMGTGALYVREGIDIAPLLYGGTGSYSESASMPTFFPDMFHAGTLNAPGIVGLLEGVNFVLKEGVMEKEKEITDYFYSALKEDNRIIIPGEEDRTSAISIIVPLFDLVELSEKLNNKFNIATRAGLHCSPMAHRTIGTITTGTLRFSPGFFTRKEDIDSTLISLKKIIEN